MLVGNVQLVAGSSEKIDAIMRAVEHEGIETHKNPDIYLRTYTSFGADEARELRMRTSLRALGRRRVFIVVASVMTTEAQNILLKTIEEPSDDALFIFVVPSPHTLLPTIRSRAQVLSVGGDRVRDQIDARQFLASSPAARADMLKPLMEKDEGDPSRLGGRAEAGKRDIGAIITFLSSLESSMGAVKDVGIKREGLRSIYRARHYITDKGALVKSLLEQVALIVPRV